MDALLQLPGLSGPLGSAVDLVLDAAIRGTVLLTLAGLACLLLGRGTAAARHLCWSLALAGMIALPVLGRLLPAWSVPLVPPLSLAAVLPQAGAGADALPAPDAGRDTALAADPGPAPRAESAAAVRTSVASVPALGPGSRTDGGATWTSSAPALLGLLWLAGAVLVLGRLLAGMLHVRLVARRARPVQGAAWRALLQSVSGALGLRRRVQLLQAAHSSVPMTWGALRPVVLVPAGAEQWSAAQRRLVLLHELAHVRRLDCVTQGLAQMACALYWFHPLVWHAASRLRSEREHACDDLVLGGGEKPSDYAGLLLEIARTMSSNGCTAMATLAMARRSQLEGRLLAILDPARPRRSMRPAAERLWAAGLVLLLLPLAALRPATAADEPTPQPPPQAAVQTQQPDASQPESVRPDADEPASAGGQSILDVLQEVVDRDPDPDVRRKAVEALARRPEKDVLARLERIARTHRDRDVRLEAIESIRHAGEPQQVLELLLSLVEQGTDDEIQQHAVEALRHSDGSFPHLVRIARTHRNPDVRTQAVEALRHSEDPAALGALIELAEQGTDTDVQQHAVEALRHLAQPEALSALKSIARTHPQPEVRKQAVEALGHRPDSKD